ncbi:hypothetical protein TNCV_951471 [Trichonephila clavipes]|nr:hypothetical protein TNCV_951471 [Trichonephila clavipes]
MIYWKFLEDSQKYLDESTCPVCKKRFFDAGTMRRHLKCHQTIRELFVISATCTCPAGGTPVFCKHVFALLHAINDYIAKKLYEALNFFHSYFFI